MQSAQKLYSISEAAQQLGVSAETLRRWERSGRIKVGRTPTGNRIFSEEDIEFLRSSFNTRGPVQTAVFPIPVQVVPHAKAPRATPNFKNLNYRILAMLLITFASLAVTFYTLFTFTPYPNQAARLAARQVLGVKDFIAPALSESSPLGNLLGKVGGFFRGGSFVVLFGRDELEVGDDLNVKGKAIIAKDIEGLGNIRIKGTAIVERLKTNIIDPYLIENDGDVQSFLEIRTLPSALGSSDIVFTPGGIEKLRIKESGNIQFNGSLSGINNITATGTISGGDTTIGKLSTSGTINGNTFEGNKLVFLNSNPNIYPATTNSGIALNANGTGTINIGFSSTGNVQFFSANNKITSSGNLIINGSYSVGDNVGQTLTQCGSSQYLGGIKVTGGIITALGSCTSVSSSPSWSSLTDPTANLSLTMAAFTTTLTYNATTGTGNLFTLTDTASNTGTGYLLNLTTASSSTLLPFRVQARGNTIIDTTATGGVTIGNATSAQAVTIDAGTATLNLGNSNNAKTINIGTGTAIDTINIGTGATGVDVIQVGSSVASLALTDADWSITTGGVLSLSSGTGTAPSFSFTGDTNTGILRVGPDQLGFATGGGTQVIIDGAQVQLANGSVGSPVLAFQSDTASGIYRPALSNLGLVTAGTERVRIDSSGNVGIGTTSPGTATRLNITGDVTSMVRLDRTANANIDAIFEIAPTFPSAGNSVLHIGTTTTATMYIAEGGNVGIGTASPNVGGSGANARVLTISGASADNPGVLELRAPAPIVNTNLGIIQFFSGSTQVSQIISTTDGAIGSGFLAFLTRADGGSLAERWRITSGGNLLAGTDNTYTIGASGASRPSNIYAVGCAGAGGLCTDIAENYPTAETVEPGDLVAFSPLGGKKVMKAYGSFDAIGIVSTTPGVTLGEGTEVALGQNGLVVGTKKEGEVPVALAGRVPTKVSIENGEIKVGDYLTSSGTKPGLAMAACSREPGKQCKPGRTIGIALEEANVDGKIMIFVNPSWYDPSIYIAENGDLSLKVDNIETKKLTISEGTNKEVLTATSSAKASTDSVTLDPSILSRLDSLEKLVLGTPTSSSSATFDNLTVLKKLLITDLGITGKVTSGLLSIDGLNGSINSLGELKLQDLGAAGVNILSGKVTIDASGNLKLDGGSLTAKKYNVQAADSASASLGKATLPLGQTSITINTVSVATDSAVFVTLETTSDRPLAVTEKVVGQSFKVELPSPAPKDLKFNWWIVN